MNESKDTAQSPGLHVDSDWKAAAQAEKQRLADESRKAGGGEAGGAAGKAAAKGGAGQAAGGGAGSRRPLPGADFQTLVSTMVTQAMYTLGMIPDPQTGQRVAMLDLARHHIDMLGVLEQKTEGNLSDDEKKLLATALYELRMQYVQLSQQAIREQTGGAPGSGEAV
jgi:Domain of unknown function (DUF1844)